MGSASGGGTNSMPPGTPYGGGTVTGQSTFSGPPVPAALTSFSPPNMMRPTPAPGSSGPGPGTLQHPYGALAGQFIGSLLQQALFSKSQWGGPLPGGMNPLGAPSPLGSSGFTPGLRGAGSGGIGSLAQGNVASGGGGR